MAKPKRKLLPKDFEELLRADDLDAIKAVFDLCDVNARGGYLKRTALGFRACSDELSRWLVEQGADLAALDDDGETPLHARAGDWVGRIEILLELGADLHATSKRGDTPLHRAARVANLEAARLLLARGARLDVLNAQGLTPLGLALESCSNARVDDTVAVVELLFDAQAPKAKTPRTGVGALAARLFGGGNDRHGFVTPQMKAAVERIGTQFERYRATFNPESLPACSAALYRLYVLFDVPPVPRRVEYDSRSPIRATADGWEDRHDELWELLVPPMGAASTVQGEVIRISGRVKIEVYENGGINWDAEYKKMTKAFLGHIASGVPLSDEDRARAARWVADIRRDDAALFGLSELAVKWVDLNPTPIALSPPDYTR